MHRRLLGTALAAALLLGGCSDDPEPKVADPEPTAASSSTLAGAPMSSASSAPVLPAAARTHNDQGAEAFAMHYIDLLNFAQRTGVTTQLDEHSHPACAGCLGYVQAIEKAYADGGRVKGGQIVVRGFSELPPDYGADWAGYAEAHSTAQILRTADGVATRFPGGTVRVFVYTAWVNDKWVMRWMRTPS